MISTGSIAAGLLAAVVLWQEMQTAIATGLGLILMMMGCTLFAIGLMVGEPSSRPKAKRRFWMVNLWLLPFIPLSLLYNNLMGGFATAPYPVPVNSLVAYGLFWVVYLGGCAAAEWRLLRKTEK